MTINFVSYTKYLKQIMPTFCFQTADEILSIFTNQNIAFGNISLRTIITGLVKDGRLIRRKCKRTTGMKRKTDCRSEYARNPNWK